MTKGLKKFRPFQSWQFEEHAEWLAAMSRTGWHYKGQDFIGLQHFEHGAPAELEYCWDKAPRASEEGVRYRKRQWSDLLIVVLLLLALLSARDALRAQSRVRALAQSA